MYKTVLCHQYKATGNCMYNNKCRYTHRQDELQPISNHPLYKTILCRSYHNEGTCNYGAKCKFIHELSKKRVPNPRKSITTTFHFALNTGSNYRKLALNLNSNPHPRTLSLSTWIITLWPIFKIL